MRAAADEEPLPSLLEACFHGDGAAQSRFFLRYQELTARSVARTLSRYCTQPPVASDVEDLVQEVFEKLLKDNCRALLQVRGASNITAWMNVVARNLTVDALRSEGARSRAHSRLRGHYGDEELPVHAAPPHPAAAMVREEAVEMARCFLDSLPHQQRLSMQLFYEEGMSYAQIATVLGQPPNTVASHLHRARQRLVREWHARQTVDALPEAGEADHGI